MTLQELNDLDFSSLGNIPGTVKLIIAVLLCALVVGAGYYLFTQKTLLELDKETKQEKVLLQSLEKKQAKAANLNEYKQQLEEMKQTFGAMLRKLPNKTEVAELLVDVSQTGLAAGLEFELFRPGAEVAQEFYAELPIQITVYGQYHQFGQFISGLAALPRIVTIHNISITGGAGKGRQAKAANGRLVMHATAKTYRYLEQEG